MIHDILRMPQDAADIKIHGPFFNLTMNIRCIIALPALSTSVRQRIRLSLLTAWVISQQILRQNRFLKFFAWVKGWSHLAVGPVDWYEKV